MTLILTSCDIFTEPKNHKPQDTGTVSGVVTTYSFPDFILSYHPVVGATVTIGNRTVITNGNGSFTLTNIPVGQNIRISYNSADCIPFQRVITIQKGRTTNADIQLNTARSFTALGNESFTLWEEGNDFTFPENALADAQGHIVTGNIIGKTRNIWTMGLEEPPPTYLPGNFRGIRTNGTSVILEYYASMYASVYDAANPTSELKLASGKSCAFSAIGRINYSSSTIPMWHYDATRGLWIEQGNANFDYTYFTGSISKLGYWLFATPINEEQESIITGSVMYYGDEYGNPAMPVSNALVTARGVDYGGCSSAYTDLEGRYSIRVKANSHVELKAALGCDNTDTSVYMTSVAVNESVEAPYSVYLSGPSVKLVVKLA